jgi:hypothetical protein
MTEEQGSATRDEERQDQPQDMEHKSEGEGDEQEARGADSPADKEAKGDDSGEGGDSDEAVEGEEEAKREIQRLEEEGPPEKLEDWPTGQAKYETFGGPEGEHPYHEGPEAQMGPPDVRHREDGSVEVAGEEVDDPKEFKGEPIPGGPTDPDTPNLRMDRASPEDVSDVAQKAADEGGDESSESDDSESERSDGDGEE